MASWIPRCHLNIQLSMSRVKLRAGTFSHFLKILNHRSGVTAGAAVVPRASPFLPYLWSSNPCALCTMEEWPLRRNVDERGEGEGIKIHWSQKPMSPARVPS